MLHSNEELNRASVSGTRWSFVVTAALVTLMAITVLGIAGCKGESAQSSPDRPMYERESVDPDGPRSPWGKTVGDINGDGLPDIVVGGHQPRRLSTMERLGRKLGLLDFNDRRGELVWYQSPIWQRHVVSEAFRVRTDMEVADVDGDNRNDIVLLADAGLLWVRNGDWEPQPINSGKFHDVEVVDLDRDGDVDIVARNQSLFGYENGNRIHIFRQDPGHTWHAITQSVPHGEGLRLADIDGDGFDDIVVNQVWLENPGRLSEQAHWRRAEYATDWVWRDVFIDTGDINGDGRPDIVLAPAEVVGQRYDIAWFEAPEHPDGVWTKHIVDEDVEAVHHFVAARDVDLDGDLDILTAEMNQGEGDNPVKLYLNEESGWRKQIIAQEASHSMRAVDIDNDFDIDLMGTNWQIANYDGSYPVKLWRNSLPRRITWERHVIDAARPGQATFIFAEDLNGDGLRDLIVGGFWYRQPGSLAGRWPRSSFGKHANNVAYVADFDKDGDIDVLASGWRGYNQAPTLYERILNWLSITQNDRENDGKRFVWLENDGTGHFRLHNNIETASGDFLQGTARLPGAPGQMPAILLSWHRQGEGLQGLSIPKQPDTDTWRWYRVSEISQDEAISVADMDQDGSPDIVLGTLWLRNQGRETWVEQVIEDTDQKPDRHQVIDMNGDGRLDVVVGFEAVSRKGELVWYQQPEAPGVVWQKHRIDEVTGPMSLDVVDIDNDGDLDVVVGEHDLQYPDQARLLWFENRQGNALDWQGHLIHRGDEHHDGALGIDIDNDGDIDIVSIGWGHGKVVLYENKGVPE